MTIIIRYTYSNTGNPNFRAFLYYALSYIGLGKIRIYSGAFRIFVFVVLIRYGEICDSRQGILLMDH